MAKKHNQKYYMELCQKALQEIMKTPKSEPERFKILQKKAEKYLKRAKSFESSRQSTEKQGK